MYDFDISTQTRVIRNAPIQSPYHRKGNNRHAKSTEVKLVRLLLRDRI